MRASDTTAQNLFRNRAALALKARRFVRDNPLLALAAAGAVGTALGTLALPHLARLLFVGTVGFLGNELRRGGGRVSVDAMVKWLSSDDRAAMAP